MTITTSIGNKLIKSISIGGVDKHQSNQTNDESMSRTLLTEVKRFVENSSNRNFETKLSNHLQKEEINPKNDYL